jgi:hypothetical protein
MPVIVFRHCPRCRAVVDNRIEFFNSGLGAPLYVCRKCERVYASGRQEWVFMSAARKARYSAVSVLYMAGILTYGGILGLVLGFAWKDPLFHGHDRRLNKTDLANVIAGAVISALVILVIQALRVTASALRCPGPPGDDHDEPEPYRPPGLLAWGWHPPVMAGTVVVLVVGWLFCLFASRLR